MQGGDLSNQLPPRWLVVFEGVIGVLPTTAEQRRFHWWTSTHAWRRAVDTFQLDEHTGKVLWDLTWRRSMKFDVATFLPGPKTGKHVEDWLEARNLPVANVRQYESPSALGKQLAYLPDVYAVVHNDPASEFTYGQRGRLLNGHWVI